MGKPVEQSENVKSVADILENRRSLRANRATEENTLIKM